MARALTSKEQSVADRFSKHGLEEVGADPISFTGKGMMFNVKEPVIYKIASSNSILVFGELRKSMGLDEIKQWLEQQVQMNRGHAEDGDAVEIDGEEKEHVCSHGCGHGADDAVEEVDEESGDPNIHEEDVNLIMSQVKISRDEVVKALKASDYDVVNTLVELTKNN